MEILIQNKTQRKVEENLVVDIAEKVIRAELGDKNPGVLNILLTGDSEIKSINREF